MSELPLTVPVFSILTSLIEERVGLSYTLSDKAIFESKACAHAFDAGFESMLDYYYHLRYDDPEQQAFSALVEALLVHETFFFRELEPLRVALEHFIVPLVSSGRRARIWCAACSTGEEVLTIAMLLADRGLLGRVELIASDISAGSLAQARRGRFSRRALRQHALHPLAARYIEVRQDELLVAPDLLEVIDFRQLNLTDPRAVASVGNADLIVCRNVFIYFRDQVASRVADSLGQALRPGGVLLVGVSESLLRLGTSLVCEEHANVFVYRKRVPS